MDWKLSSSSDGDDIICTSGLLEEPLVGGDIKWVTCASQAAIFTPQCWTGTAQISASYNGTARANSIKFQVKNST